MKSLRCLVVPVMLFLTACASGPEVQKAPQGFVALDRFIPGLVMEIRYHGSDNFVGRPIDGYEAPRCYLTRQAAEALKAVQDTLSCLNLSLKVFDGYRPQRAVDHFARWARDLADTAMKASYYPTVQKQHLFRDGYIAARSGHSRGSAVDVTIVDSTSGEAWDMGTSFDFFGPLSHTLCDRITPEQQRRRLFLQGIMARHGFEGLAEEWWHFKLRDEPYPDTYFDFPLN